MSDTTEPTAKPLLKPYVPRTGARPEIPVYSKEFESRKYPGEGIAVDFVQLDGLDQGRLTVRTAELMAQYVLGTHPDCPVDPVTQRRCPLELPGMAAKDQRRLTEPIVQNAATLEIMQAEDARQCREAETYLLMAKDDFGLFSDACAFANEVNEMPLPKV